MRTAATDDRGSVLPFTATIVVALLACSGLAVDGGRILAARREAAGIAAAAARRGSQELAWNDAVTGQATIDVTRATAAARSAVHQAGASGSASATPDRITVTVTIDEPTVILGWFGIGPRTVTATRAASPFAGG
jgi:Flp pilus assembly protein TadG